MKKLIAILLAICLLTAYAVPVNAAETSGKCGENVTWRLEDNVVYISGTGPMYDYSEENPSPFPSLSHKTYYFVIEEGVTSIGDYAFTGGVYYIILIAASVSKIGHKSFAYGSCQGTFLGPAPSFETDSLSWAKSYTFRYITGWEESDLLSSTTSHHWEKVEPLLAAETKTVYSLNEEIKPEDFQFYAPISMPAMLFSPQAVQVEAYDNSTYGIKTVKVVALDREFTHTYFVSDGQNHLDSVNVKPLNAQYYTGEERKPEPVVKADKLVLTKDVHYTLSYQNNINVGTAQVTVTGIGAWEGFSKTVSFPILRRDISDGVVHTSNPEFRGEPVAPNVSVYVDNQLPKENEDYVIFFQNNVNIGTASYCAVGIGNYYGYASGNFQVNHGSKDVTLKGAFNGYATGELNTDFYYEEAIVPPGVFKGSVNAVVGSTSKKHYAYYELYRLEGEEPILVTKEESAYGYHYTTAFTYDFSSVYEDAAEEGGEIYMLSYAWVDSEGGVYSGVYVMAIPAKVPEATSMVVEQLEGVDDFRRAYLCAYSTDGNLGKATWTTSDSSIATVDGGVVTLRTPGTVTITAQCGSLTASREIVAEAQDLTQCDILNYDPQTGKAEVYYNDCLLIEGTEYVLTVSENAGVVTVTATGCGLFTGQISREFDADDVPLEHTHTFDNCEDATCNTCEHQRTAGHLYGDQWFKTQTHHYQACTACGKQVNLDQHTPSAEDNTVCTVCGPLQKSGDVKTDGVVDEDDAIYLLQHVLLPEFFPIAQNADFTGDNKVNEDDAIYLLQHVLLPEFFPL